MKKLDGIFGLKLDEYFDENQFTIISKELNHGDYHITIDSPPKPNVLFKDYSIRCSKDMIIQDISAKTLSPIPFDKAKARQEDIENYFIETYFDNYAIYYWYSLSDDHFAFSTKLDILKKHIFSTQQIFQSKCSEYNLLTGIASLFGIVALWSFIPSLIKLLLPTFDPFVLGFLRLILATFVYLGLFVYNRHTFAEIKFSWWYV